MRNLILTTALGLALGLAVSPVLLLAATANEADNASAKAMGITTGIDSHKLIGHEVVGSSNEYVGIVDSLILRQDGRVDQVILGVGGFLGLGQRKVALHWKDLTIDNASNRVFLNASADEVRNRPDVSENNSEPTGAIQSTTSMKSSSAVEEWQTTPAGGVNGHAINARTTGREVPDQDMAAANSDRSKIGTSSQTKSGATTKNDAGTSASILNINFSITASDVKSANFENASGDTLGSISDLVLTPRGQVQGIVVNVGSVAGVGGRDVMVKWSQLELQRNGADIVVVTNIDRSTLENMQPYEQPPTR